MSFASVVTYDHMLQREACGVKRKDVVSVRRRPSKRAKILDLIMADYSFHYPSALTTLSSQCSNNIKFQPQPEYVFQKIEDRQPHPEHDFDRQPEPERDLEIGQKVEDRQAEPEHDLETCRGASLTDSFTADQIKQHMASLSRTPVKYVDDDTCQLCDKQRLLFAAPPMECAHCHSLIKAGLTCYNAVDESNVRYSFCAICYNKARGYAVAGEKRFLKQNLTKAKNVGVSEETWVQCDGCDHWQHQICALYNSEHDAEGKITYFCPHCRLLELDQPIINVPVTPILGARDLPRTELSDHIEQWLFKHLALERMSRAEKYGKLPEEVPSAENLVVRTVLAVDRQVKVKQQFLNIFQGQTYPSEFPYKSKVIMLFQEVEGAEVCLFAMYVQEYGTECGEPNQRSVYISYIDSVKYFTPDIKACNDQPLRTFVYHEMLIGYLDYCKQRGFNTCYIWACPPVKGDNYILYCHPETQRMPKKDKLRKWYKTMFNQAMAYNVVVGYTNFCDYFLVPKNLNDKITAARLPYYDGDYWTGAIENMMEKDCTEKSKKPKKSMSKRKCKAMGHNGTSLDAATDIQVMTRLGETMQLVKEDFFVVCLQFTCVSCRNAILCGSRWSCGECNNLHLCDRCLEFEQSHEGLITHTTHRGETHALMPYTVINAASGTKDKDVVIDNEIFENRHAFLYFCQKKNYQFDSLRGAKHSTTMILFHLHKHRRM